MSSMRFCLHTDAQTRTHCPWPTRLPLIKHQYLQSIFALTGLPLIQQPHNSVQVLPLSSHVFRFISGTYTHSVYEFPPPLLQGCKLSFHLRRRLGLQDPRQRSMEIDVRRIGLQLRYRASFPPVKLSFSKHANQPSRSQTHPPFAFMPGVLSACETLIIKTCKSAISITDRISSHSQIRRPFGL